jgi:2',3'-cyclic-nucleotide 2'-phosphodiesterase (5'-nucleotidase family)
MNRMGYDALVLGPKDLALGSAVLKQRIAEAKFAVLSANAVLSATGELLAKPYVVREFAGHRVAIVGLSGGPATVDIAVRNPLETAKKVTDEAAKEADIVILLSHAGPKLDQQIADTVSGIAMIVSGGPGALQEPRVSTKTGTPIYHADAASSGHAGRMLGVAVLEFTPQGELTSQTWQSVSLGPEIADDPAMAAWVQEQMKR